MERRGDSGAPHPGPPPEGRETLSRYVGLRRTGFPSDRAKIQTPAFSGGKIIAVIRFGIPLVKCNESANEKRLCPLAPLAGNRGGAEIPVGSKGRGEGNPGDLPSSSTSGRSFGDRLQNHLDHAIGTEQNIPARIADYLEPLIRMGDYHRKDAGSSLPLTPTLSRKRAREHIRFFHPLEGPDADPSPTILRAKIMGVWDPTARRHGQPCRYRRELRAVAGRRKHAPDGMKPGTAYQLSVFSFSPKKLPRWRRIPPGEFINTPQNPNPPGSGKLVAAQARRRRRSRPACQKAEGGGRRLGDDSQVKLSNLTWLECSG